MSFFESDATKARLERQIKTNIILYDRVILQNGRFQIFAGARGQGLKLMHPHDSFPGSRRTISYYAPGSQFGVAVGGMQVLSAANESAYEVDFFPIVHDAKLEDVTFIRWSNDVLVPELCSKILTTVREQMRSNEYAEVLPKHPFLGENVLLSVYEDSLLAFFNNFAICMDAGSSTLIHALLEKQKLSANKEIPMFVYDFWLRLNLPDFASLGWDELCEIRESDAGRSFREMVRRISQAVAAAVPQAKDAREIDKLVAEQFSKELVAELQRRIRTPSQTLASICLNLLPFGAIPSIGLDLQEFGNDQQSWVSLLRPLG